MHSDLSSLVESFVNKTAKIGVIGLGYVGLPLVLTFVDKGFHTVGFDIDETKITALKNGESYISHISSEDVSAAMSTGRVLLTSDFSEISQVDAVLICVPTPLTKNSEPDLSFVSTTGEHIAPHLQANQLSRKSIHRPNGPRRLYCRKG